MNIDSLTVKLLVPPVFDWTIQTLGIPALSAWLKQKGFKTEKYDLNIDFARYITGKDEINTDVLRDKYLEITNSEYYQKNYDVIKDTEFIRNEIFFGFSNIVCNNYSRLFTFLNDTRVNVYIQYFNERGLIDKLLLGQAQDIIVVGISILGENQLVSSLTLAKLLKERDPNVFIVFGGPWITVIWDVLINEPQILEYVDFMIPFDGEVPLENLCNALIKDKECINDLEGVVYRKNGEFTFTESKVSHIRAENLPMADLFPLTDYLFPFVIPYETVRGCYWGKCKFCYHISKYEHTFNSKSVTKIMNELKQYKEQTNFYAVTFNDAGILPNRMMEISEGILKNKLSMKWFCFSYIDKNFTKEIFKKASKSGLFIITFGIETVSSRLSEYIGKPINEDLAFRILKDCNEAGILPASAILNGFPSETTDDLNKLWLFLDKIKHFSWVQPQLFRFERKTEFYKNADTYNLEIIKGSYDNTLAICNSVVDHNPGATREYIKTEKLNEKWKSDNRKFTRKILRKRFFNIIWFSRNLLDIIWLLRNIKGGIKEFKRKFARL